MAIQWKRAAREFVWPSSRSGKIRMLVATLLLMAILVGGCGSGNRLFYWPNDLVYNNPVADGRTVEDVVFDSADGTKLHGWYLPAQGGAGPVKGTVIYFHGNAQNLTAHYEFVSWLPAHGYNLFLFDYRGFGQSQGTPSREGTFQDSVAAIEYLAARPDQRGVPRVVFGQSLGGALSLAALGESGPHGVCGLAVESTFYSYQGVAQWHAANIWWTWLVQWPLSHWLVTDDHSPSHSLANLQGLPLLVIHGDADKVVPYSQGETLFQHAPEPKRFIRVPGGSHCGGTSGFDLQEVDRYRKELLKFFDECVAGQRRL
jgi:fermentation-respiration switch protein FrsA (DUF1100 family)